MSLDEDICELEPVTEVHRDKPESIIILVHGTAARETEWIEQGSEVCKAITKPGRDVYRFLWSGENSHEARLKAANSFEEKLIKLVELPRNENARLYIIAHSHGGNVSLYAMSEELRKRLTGLVCLATPFLHFYKTALGTKVLFALSGLAALLILSIAVTALQNGAFAPPLTAVAGGVAAFSLVLIYASGKLRKAGFRLPFRKLLRVMFRGDIDDWTKRLELPELDTEKFLIIRPVADEAAGALVSAQFSAWVGRKIWSNLGRIWRFVPIAIGVFGFVGWGVDYILTEASANLYGNIGSLVIGLAIFALGAVALLILFLITLANAPFGYDALALSFRGQTAAADSPLGKAVVVQLALTGFRHSEIYKAAAAIEHIKAFIQSLENNVFGHPSENSGDEKQD